MHPGACICKSQLLMLFIHVVTHSSARFYRRCKRHPMTTKFNYFRDRLVKMIIFFSFMNYLQEQTIQKANEILLKAGTYLSSLKIVTVIKINLTLYKNMTGNLLPLKWWQAKSEISVDQSINCIVFYPVKFWSTRLGCSGNNLNLFGDSNQIILSSISLHIVMLDGQIHLNSIHLLWKICEFQAHQLIWLFK